VRSLRRLVVRAGGGVGEVPRAPVGVGLVVEGVGQRTLDRLAFYPAVQVRPDGYVAWAGAETGDIAAAVELWCGTTEQAVR
jgi:hypothetical protein